MAYMYIEERRIAWEYSLWESLEVIVDGGDLILEVCVPQQPHAVAGYTFEDYTVLPSPYLYTFLVIEPLIGRVDAASRCCSQPMTKGVLSSFIEATHPADAVHASLGEKIYARQSDEFDAGVYLILASERCREPFRHVGSSNDGKPPHTTISPGKNNGKHPRRRLD